MSARDTLTRDFDGMGAEQNHRQSTLPSTCTWFLADQNTTVELRWNLRHAQRTIREQGAFGLLLGRIVAGSSRTIEIRRVAAANRVRRAAQSAGAGGAELAGAQIGTVDDSGDRVLGFYRTIPGDPADSLTPTPEDQSALEHFCAAPPGLVLLLEGCGDQLTGAFYLWDETGLDDMSPMVLPLAPAVVTPAPMIPPPVPSSGPAPAPDSTRYKFQLKVLLLGILLGLVAMTGINLLKQARVDRSDGHIQPEVLARSANGAGNDAGNDASLSVESVGGMLQIRWNPSSAAIRSCDSGSIVITDGPESKTVPLSVTELRIGLMLYSPTNKHLIVNLVANRDGQRVVESAITIGAPFVKAAGVVVPANPVVKTLAQPTKPPAEVAPPNSPRQAAVDQSAKPQEATREESVARLSAGSAAAVQFPASQTSKPPQTERETAPLVSSSAPPIVSHDLSTAPKSVPAVQQPPTPAATQDNFTPAVPVGRLFVPRAEPFERMLTKSVKISVTVSVDASGKVTNVAAATPNSVVGALAARAVDYVKSRTFEPARRNGVPVASQLVIMFNFDKK